MSHSKSPTDTVQHAVVLDICRGIAALWVFTYHFPLSPALGVAHPLLSGLFSQGYLGVPMFFVISGYCMMAAADGTQRRHEPVSVFIRRRIRRIYPPFLYSILVAVAAPFVIEMVSALKTGTFAPPELRYAHYSVADWVQLATLTRGLVQQDQTQAGAFTAVNAVYWTLAIELQFYVVLAAALACGRHFRRVIAAVTAVSLAFMLHARGFSFGIFLPWWPIFALGMGLYAIQQRGWTPRERFGTHAPSIIAGAVAALGIVMALELRRIHAAEDSQIFSLCFAAILWLTSGLERPLASAAARWWVRPTMLLGVMSYSVYLVHNRLFYLSAQVIGQLIAEDSLLFNAAVVGVTLAGCYAFHLVCEKPFCKPAAGFTSDGVSDCGREIDVRVGGRRPHR